MMEGYGDRDSYGVVEEEKKPLVKRGCSAGRIMNCCIAFDYFLIMLTALIVSGVLGVLNNKLKNHYPDSSPNNRTCILFASCQDSSTPCDVIYNSSGACEFIAAGFGIIAFAALVYIVACVVRIVFATDIWLWTVIADIVLNTCIVVGVIVMGIIISVGLAVTCSSVGNHYSGTGNCSVNAIPDVNGYRFYKETNAAQGAAWFCFLFAVIATVIFIVRSCILCRRKAKVPAMDSTEVLTAADDFKETDQEPARAV